MLPRRLAPYALAYAAYYATVGALLPYLSALFEARGFDATERSVLLSFAPLLATVTPMLTGLVADALGRPRAMMAVAIAGAMSALIALSESDGFAAAMGCMIVYASFHPSILVLLEASTLRELERGGGAYARVRVFGSVAFVLASFGLGLWLDARSSARAEALEGVLLFAAAALGAQLVTTAWLSSAAPARKGSELRGAIELLRRPGLVILLAASTLHWVAMAPYHTLYAVHVHALGLPDGVVGASMALGATAEIVVMTSATRLESRFGARAMITAALAASVLRWALSGWVTSAPALIAVQLLHGLSFGAFYVAAMALMRSLVPTELRATGQGLFIASVFGLGGVVGTYLTGLVTAELGGSGAFYVSALVSASATLLWWRYKTPGAQS